MIPSKPFNPLYMIYHYKKSGCLLAILAVLSCVQFSCKKTRGYNEVISTDKTKPGPVTGVQVTNFDGGAYITYVLPDSKNILYVQAQYMINDKVSRQTKSSYYSDSITVSGFAQSKDYRVILHTVSRANVSSDSVVVTVHPKTPPYLAAFPTVTMQDDFGGVHIGVTNLSGADIGIITILPDPVTGKYEILDQHYTNLDSVAYSLRGFDTLPRRFGVYITDQWGNISDTLFTTIHPIFETEMSKSLFQPYVLPSDVGVFGDYWGVRNLWDNNYGEPTYNTQQPITPLVWPAWVTFDMGQTAKLSRYNLVGRGGDNGEFLWREGTPQTWVIWGRADAPVDEIMPSDTSALPPVGGSTAGGWINMGVFHAFGKPSGLPDPQFTNQDWDFWKAGFNYDFSLDLPKVRYIRFECLENMGETNNFFDMNELTFYGDPR